MNVFALTVFVMGLRHGADPDHLAAIDNLTRNASDRHPAASRFVGFLFALGHSAMVIFMACLAALAGSRIGALASGFTRAGDISSVAILITIGIANIVTLVRGGSVTLRTRLLPRALASATHPLAGVPTGALFGIGFETQSQLAAFGLAFSSANWLSGIIVGAAFCAGMICTDTLDSIVLAKLFIGRTGKVSQARRVWIVAVTAVAFGVALQEIAVLLGWRIPLGETASSAAIVGLLAAVAIALVCLRTAEHARNLT